MTIGGVTGDCKSLPNGKLVGSNPTTSTILGCLQQTHTQLLIETCATCLKDYVGMAERLRRQIANLDHASSNLVPDSKIRMYTAIKNFIGEIVGSSNSAYILFKRFALKALWRCSGFVIRRLLFDSVLEHHLISL